MPSHQIRIALPGAKAAILIPSGLAQVGSVTDATILNGGLEPRRVRKPFVTVIKFILLFSAGDQMICYKESTNHQFGLVVSLFQTSHYLTAYKLFKMTAT